MSRLRLDMVQQRYGLLTVAEYSHSDKEGTFWKCLCDCGTTIVAPRSRLVGGGAKSCGCSRKKPALIRLEGNVAYISLTRGFEAIIDAEDIHLAEGRAWCAKRDRNTLYATAHKGIYLKTDLLHRVIMGSHFGELSSSVLIDHIDGDGLNCRKSNMRLATNAENVRNRRVQKNNTTGYRGVSYNPKSNATNPYIASIKADKKKIYLGSFPSAEVAYEAYCSAAKRLHGDFSRT